ncbi:MAG: RNA-guided endonuclease InsQ/TnpB family protein, partial [Candidatus Bipolaricaulia bacterium]
TSAGDYEDHPQFLRQSENKLKQEQRRLSRKQTGSKNREKQRVCLEKAHEKVKNQRLDFLHKLSRFLVSRYDTIVFEELYIPGLVQNPHLAKSILDAGWGTLIQLTTYKSVALGGKVVQVDPRYTSQRCSRCGAMVPKTLSVRVHSCAYCGLVLDRDENAARNILRVGQELSEPKSNACRDETSTLSFPLGQVPSLKQEAPSLRKG